MIIFSKNYFFQIFFDISKNDVYNRGQRKKLMKRNLQKTAYDIIRDRIIACEYLPGAMLTEEYLKDSLNISRTPVRGALGRLEQEGLVIIKPKKGILVSPITMDEVNNIYEVRILYETFAIANYGNLIGVEDLYEAYNTLNRLDIEGMDKSTFFNMDDEFHRMIMRVVKNKYILRSYDTIYAQNSRLRLITGLCSEKRLYETKDEHLVILKHCLEKNWQKARRELQDHLLNSKSVAFEYLLNQNTFNIND